MFNVHVLHVVDTLGLPMLISGFLDMPRYRRAHDKEVGREEEVFPLLRFSVKGAYSMPRIRMLLGPI